MDKIKFSGVEYAVAGEARGGALLWTSAPGADPVLVWDSLESVLRLPGAAPAEALVAQRYHDGRDIELLPLATGTRVFAPGDDVPQTVLTVVEVDVDARRVVAAPEAGGGDPRVLRAGEVLVLDAVAKSP